MRGADINTPMIIYSSVAHYRKASPDQLQQVFGFTNRPNELFKLVLSALGRR
jgi:hypothetical protein